VSILEDQYQFVLHHRIMWEETDDKVAVPIIEEARECYPLINQCSFDKGYYSKENIIELNKQLDNVIMPKKGRCNQEEKAWQESKVFGEARRQHSGVIPMKEVFCISIEIECVSVSILFPLTRLLKLHREACFSCAIVGI